jgi:hypothetical protein
VAVSLVIDERRFEQEERAPAVPMPGFYFYGYRTFYGIN